MSIEDFKKPRWIRMRERYTIAGIPNQRARFMDYSQFKRSYRHGRFPQPGYNPNHDSTRVERIRLDRDDVTLKGR
jgi:hypothetical protein